MSNQELQPGEILALNPSAMEALEKSDPVMAFYRRVSDAAASKPYWSEDFRRATYDALCDEYGRHVIEKHGWMAKL